MALVVKCPTCRKETTWENNSHRPFCSDRCQLIDLGAWTEGRFKIAGDQLDSPVDNQDDDDDETQWD